MTIKQQGGVFGRNPTFNDVDVEGNLTVAGSPISAGGTIASQDADNVNIDGGAIDGTVIGANTKANVTGASAVFDDLTVDTNTLFVNATNNQVGIGTTSPSIAKLQIDYLAAAELGMKLIGSNTGLNNALGIYDASANSIVHSINAGTYSIASNGNEALTIYTNKNVSIADGNLILASGHGIDFSATSGTGTSELFDDYEEGSFSAVLADASSGGNVASTGNTYAQYTKVGNVVHCTISMLNIDTSGLTSGNVAYLQGLPYAAVSAGTNRFFPIYVRANSITSTLGIQGWILANGGDYIFLEDVTTSGKANLLVSALSSGAADLAVSFSYFTS